MDVDHLSRISHGFTEFPHLFRKVYRPGHGAGAFGKVEMPAAPLGFLF